MKVIGVAFVLLLPAEVFVLPDVLAEQEQTIFLLTNDVRVANGLIPLTAESRLHHSAEAKTSDMASHAYFAHTSPDNVGLADFLADAGYPYSVAGENLAIGFSDPRELVQAWIQSPTHFANLVDTEYADTGVGLSAGTYEGVPVVYVAQHYGVEKALTHAQPSELSAVVVPEPQAVETVLPESAVELAIATVSTEFGPIPPPGTTTETVSELAHTLTDILGTKKEESVPNKQTTPVISPAEPLLLDDPEGVAGITSVGSETKDILDTSAPTSVIDAERSLVQYQETGDSEITLTAFASIDGPFQSASVVIGGDEILLKDTDTYGIFRGQYVVHESSETYFRVVLVPELRVVRSDGTVLSAPLKWKTIPHVERTPIEEYTSGRTVLGSFTHLFDITNGIYFFFILLFSGALMVHIFWEIRQQHHHVTAQTLGVILLLMTLLVV